MEKWQIQDKLSEAIQLCSIHSERMTFAHNNIKKHFPLSMDNYLALQAVELSFFDQLIFRFSKMQDSMGNKLFPAILEYLGEEVKGKPFITDDVIQGLNLLHTHFLLLIKIWEHILKYINQRNISTKI